MKKYYVRKLVMCFFLMCSMMLRAKEVYNALPFDGWKQSSTNYFRFVYEDETREQALRFARIADEVWQNIAKAYYPPPEKTDVLITGRTNVVNAFAEGIRLYMTFYTKPPAMEEFGFREEWERLFFTHELIHITQFSVKEPSFFAKVFGRVFNAFDFFAIPAWYMEGITTVFETELTKGGRGRSPWFELYYKAPTLENAFLDFNEIGFENKPPRGQIYIMGYLVMRSIADRFGLPTLAKIELARANGLKFEEAVQEVTGFSAEQLFNDARKALVKKYAKERSIPEGIALIQANERADYYIPALLHEGNLLTIKQDGENRLFAVNIDVKTQKEKVLFEADFSDTYSLTASADGTIVASLESFAYEGLPGFTRSSGLYLWTEENGLCRFTEEGRNLSHPSLAKFTRRLVAVEFVQGRYRLVEINLETGTLDVLVEEEGKSFVQPAVSPDGSKMVFLSLDGTRARLGCFDFVSGDFGYIANTGDEIFDIAHPRWIDNERVQFSSNERGRLEVWELRFLEVDSDFIDENDLVSPNLVGSDFSMLDSPWQVFRQAVLSDPVGAFWCEVADESLYYASYSSTGYTLKVKPAYEYGKVPDFVGPSAPGQIVSLGELVNDYEDFWPFEKEKNEDSFSYEEKGTKQDVEKGAEKEDEQEVEKDIEAFPSYKMNQKTKIKQREVPSTAVPNFISKEIRFYNTPSLDFWIPLVDFFELEDKTLTTGFGAVGFGSGYPLQNGEQGNMIGAGLLYFPEINNVSGAFFAQFPLWVTDAFIFAGRDFTLKAQNRFLETNNIGIYLGFPVIDRYFFSNEISCYVFFGFDTQFERTYESYFDTKDFYTDSFGIASRFSTRFNYTRLNNSQKIMQTGRIEPSFLFSYYPDYRNRIFPLAELSLLYGIGSRNLIVELSGNSRYYNLPLDVPLPSTYVTVRGFSLDARVPGRTFLQAAIVMPSNINKRVFLEKLVSWDFNKKVEFDPKWATGFELEVDASDVQLALGVQKRFETLDDFGSFKELNIYFRLKYGALVFSE